MTNDTASAGTVGSEHAAAISAPPARTKQAVPHPPTVGDWIGLRAIARHLGVVEVAGDTYDSLCRKACEAIANTQSAAGCEAVAALVAFV